MIFYVKIVLSNKKKTKYIYNWNLAKIRVMILFYIKVNKKIKVKYLTNKIHKTYSHNWNNIIEIWSNHLL